MDTATLIARAEAEGVKVEWHHGGAKGVWFPRQQVISIRLGLDATQELCTLAHELGHAVHGHTGECAASAREESQADRWAAQTLISHVEYRQAELVYGEDDFTLAEELGVSLHTLRVWRSLMSSATPAKTDIFTV